MSGTRPTSAVTSPAGWVTISPMTSPPRRSTGRSRNAGPAQALGTSVGTVRSRLHRARRKIRVALGDGNPMFVTEES
ncbi:sigma factor-like helix-turn-helix DNA-binding protein [Actinoallomurus oryzae]|uniref:sigma factor-like helix-turn-helix DNA-binding protein n=1 Tax=Actinoallomurus oryzae TaxID=502180 RepID=UPI0031E6210A